MLSQQQSSLLSAIFTGHDYFGVNEGNPEQAGLQIYQHSLIANASRALAITFATVHSYIGQVEFDTLVESYLKTEMKEAYDWGEFGSTFALFISSQESNNAALLGAVAELDYVCHQAERSKNVGVDLNTLNLLSAVDAYELYLTLCAGTTLVSSLFPLDEVNATISQLTKAKKISTIEDVTLHLSTFSEQYLTHSGNKVKPLYHFVVWRPDFQANYARLSTEEYQWLSVILKQREINPISIGRALDEINNDEFSFVEWLPKAISERLINGINLHNVGNK